MKMMLAKNIRAFRKERSLTQELRIGKNGEQLLSGQTDEARDTLIKAKELASFFDASPCYDENDIRFVTRIEGASAHDDLRATAMEGVDLAINQFENEALADLWKSLSEQENHHE